MKFQQFRPISLVQFNQTFVDQRVYNCPKRMRVKMSSRQIKRCWSEREKEKNSIKLLIVTLKKNIYLQADF